VRPRRRTTISDLADHLGLDKSSVSLALRGSPKVSEETRARVLDAARRLGYRPNLAARQLASSSPQAVALVLPASLAALTSGAAVSTIRSLARNASAAGLVFMVATSEDLVKAAKGSAATTLHADGLLIWGDVPASVTVQLEALNVPMVVLDPHEKSYASYAGPAVRIDNAGGAKQVTQHLLEQGARRLLFVQGVRDHLGHETRWAGTREAWIESEPLEKLTFCLLEELTDGVLEDFASRPEGGIFCSNDRCALEVWHHLQRLGTRVPEQVLLSGFDGEPIGDLIGLTTAVFDGEALGRRALEILMKRFEGGVEPDTDIVIPVKIREGRTTRELKKMGTP